MAATGTLAPKAEMGMLIINNIANLWNAGDIAKGAWPDLEPFSLSGSFEKRKGIIASLFTEKLMGHNEKVVVLLIGSGGKEWTEMTRRAFEEVLSPLVVTTQYHAFDLHADFPEDGKDLAKKIQYWKGDVTQRLPNYFSENLPDQQCKMIVFWGNFLPNRSMLRGFRQVLENRGLVESETLLVFTAYQESELSVLEPIAFSKPIAVTVAGTEASAFLGSQRVYSDAYYAPVIGFSNQEWVDLSDYIKKDLSDAVLSVPLFERKFATRCCERVAALFKRNETNVHPNVLLQRMCKKLCAPGAKKPKDWIDTLIDLSALGADPHWCDPKTGEIASKLIEHSNQKDIISKFQEIFKSFLSRADAPAGIPTESSSEGKKEESPRRPLAGAPALAAKQAVRYLSKTAAGPCAGLFLKMDGDEQDVNVLLRRLGAARTLENKEKALELLLDQRANINAAGPTSGDTALHIACRVGNSDMVRLLLAKHADPELRNNDGHTAAQCRPSQLPSQLVAVAAPAPAEGSSKAGEATEPVMASP